MRTKLTDRQHKQMIARYTECQNYSQVAREFHIAESTVRKHLKGDKACAKKAEAKKAQNTRDMLAYLDAQKGQAQAVLTHILEAIDDEEKLSRANVRDLATAYGIIIDKFVSAAQIAQQSGPGSELLQSLFDLERRAKDAGD